MSSIQQQSSRQNSPTIFYLIHTTKYPMLIKIKQTTQKFEKKMPKSKQHFILMFSNCRAIRPTVASQTFHSNESLNT